MTRICWELRLVIMARVDTTAAIARLEDMRERLRAGVGDAIDDGAVRLLALVRTKLSGEVLQARSGALRDSIRAATDADGAGAQVFADGSIPYARIQEYGGRIDMPEIAPDKAKALAFAYGGRMVFAKHTAAHVVDIPQRSYLRSALAEFAPALLDELRKAARESLA
jgi:phage gpG-like protein